MSPGAFSVLPSLSADGRFVAFMSSADNLVPGDTNNASDIFVFDRVTCANERVSVNTAGVQGNSHSFSASVSNDGRFVAFYSQSTNLAPGATIGNAYVRDRVAGTTVHASPTSTGGWSSITNVIAMSADGRFVAFWSSASDFVPGDTNGQPDVFLRDLVLGSTTRVSVATGGAQAQGTEHSTARLSLSDDGRYVAFESWKTDLVPGDTNNWPDVFLHDVMTGTTIRVSVGAAGQQSPFGGTRPAISGDGRYVAFDSVSPLVPDDLNGNPDVFVRDVIAGATSRVSLANRGGEGTGQQYDAQLSGDGRYVAFLSDATDLVAGDNNSRVDVFVHDRTTGMTKVASSSALGVQGNGHSQFHVISNDGAFVAFDSYATNLLPTPDPDGPNVRDVFVTEWQAVLAVPDTNLLRNGSFTQGLARWGTFALPEPDDIVWNTTGGVLQFYRETGSTQAVVLQGTDARLAAFAPITADFVVGNSSAGRKRISVLIHDADFSDITVCTFWLDTGPPLAYSMRTHTTKVWSNATISFYAATADSTGFYRVDQVSLRSTPAAVDSGTDCQDPTAPVTVGLPGPNLLVNGDFSAGLAPWGTFGQIVSQIAGGVFEFYRPPGPPAGVVLQATGQAMVDNQILRATFRLGNSSSSRKRVTVLLHDSNFSDLSACTFWLPPNLPLSDYSMRMFATKAWTNAMFSVYPATVGIDPWFQLDDVVLQRANNATTVGTNCLEPDLSGITFSPASRHAQDVSHGARLEDRTAAARSRGPSSRWAGGPAGRYATQFWLPPHDTPVEVQVSADGQVWTTVETFEASETWTVFEIGADTVVYVRVRRV
jgi:Tol biopolymer transport system component